MTDTSTNPNTTYTGTTWQQVCVGRVPVGVNTSDGNFNTVNKNGGSNTHSHTTGSHTLTVAQMPSHNHSYGHSFYGMGHQSGSYGVYDVAGTDTTIIKNTGGGQSHNHGATGSASNLMLYQTKYFWKRLS